MKNLLIAISIMISTLLFSGCSILTGEEVARLPVNEVTTDDENLIIKEISLDLKKDEEIAFWSEMDIEYDGGVALEWRVEIIRDGEKLGGLAIDPTDKNITIGEVKTTINGKTDWSFSGKNTHITIEEDGKYTFKAILVASENSTLKVNQAELVMKK